MALARPLPRRDPAPHIPGRAAGEWRWPASVIVAICAITVPPVVVAAFRTPTGSVFPGYVVIARDAYVYQAIWRAGWHGAWLFHAAYTSEAQPGVLLYPWYLWPAHLLGWLPAPLLYHGLRLAAAGALLSATYALAAELFRPRLLRRWAFVLAALGGGVGALAPHGIHVGPFVTQATEMASPGTSVSDLISMAPHLPWALALMCWTLIVGMRLRRHQRWPLTLSGLAAVLGLQLIYPQLALLTALILLAWSALRHRGRPLWFSIGTAAVQLPYLIYLLWLAQHSPGALRVIRPTLDVGDPFGFIVLSHTVATSLIVVALLRGRLRGDLALPALWIVGMTAFMFLPGIRGTLGRSFMASSIPFALCATPGLLSLLRQVRAPRWRRRALVATLAASSLFGLVSLAQPYGIAAFRLDPHAEYESAAESALLARLAPHVGSRDLILTTYLDGLFVPAQTGARTFVGHPEMTIDAPRKAAEALAFFVQWSGDQREAFLHRQDIDYVLTTDQGFVGRLANDPGLRLLDRQGSAALFEVLR